MTIETFPDVDFESRCLRRQPSVDSVAHIRYSAQFPEFSKIEIDDTSSDDDSPVASPAGSNAPSIRVHSPPLRQDSQSTLRYARHAQERQDQSTARNNGKAASTSIKKPGRGEPDLKSRGSSDILRSTKAPSDVVQSTSPHERRQGSTVRQPSVQDHLPPSRQPSSRFNASEGPSVSGFNRKIPSAQNSTATLNGLPGGSNASRRDLSSSTYIIKDNGNSDATTPPPKDIRHGQQKSPGSIELARPSNVSSDVVPRTDHSKTSQSPLAIRPPSVRYTSPPSRQASNSSLRYSQYAQGHQSQGATGNGGITAPTSFKMSQNGQQGLLVPDVTNAPSAIPIPDPCERLPQDTVVHHHSGRGHSRPPSRQPSQSSLRYPPYAQDHQSHNATGNSGVPAPTSFKIPHSGRQKPPAVSTDIPYYTNATSVAPIPIPDSPRRLPQDTAVRPPSVRDHSLTPSRHPSQSSLRYPPYGPEHQGRGATGNSGTAAPTSFKTTHTGRQKPPGPTTNASSGAVPIPISDPLERLPQDTAVYQPSARGHPSPASRRSSRSYREPHFAEARSVLAESGGGTKPKPWWQCW